MAMIYSQVSVLYLSISVVWNFRRQFVYNMDALTDFPYQIKKIINAEKFIDHVKLVH